MNKLTFFKEIQNLPGRVIIEFINAFESRHPAIFNNPNIRFSFSNLEVMPVDDKNTKTIFYVQTIVMDEQGFNKNTWYGFEMQHANDFSCMNVYLRETENPNLKKAALKWFHDNYDKGGRYEQADMIEAYMSGANNALKK